MKKVNSILEENGFEVDDQVIISRTILNNNKKYCTDQSTDHNSFFCS